MRGSTIPSWVNLLLLVSIVGYLFVGGMTSRRYRVTLPFVHARYAHWVRNKMLVLLAGAIGIGAVIAAAVVEDEGLVGVLLGFGLAVSLAAVVLGTINSWRNHVGFYVSREGDLVLTRAHPAFAEAIQGALTEPIARR